MEERNKNNDQRLRDIFRQLDESSQAADNQWNVPSGQVWKNVEQRIGQERPRRGGLWWSLLAVLLLVSFGGLFYFSASSEKMPLISETEQKIIAPTSEKEKKNNPENVAGLSIADAVAPTTIPAVSASLSANPNDRIAASASVAQEPVKSNQALRTESPSKTIEASAASPDVSIATTTTGDSQPTRKAVPLVLNNNDKILNDKGPQPTSAAPGDVIDSESNTNIATSALSNFETSDIAVELRKLPILSSVLLLDRPSAFSIPYKVDLPKGEEDDHDLPKALNYPALLLGAYYAPSISNNDLRGEAPDIIAGNESGYNLRNFGVRVEAMLSRHFAVEIGVQRNAVNLRSSYNIRFPYLNNSEQANARGNFDTEFSHSLPSPAGNVNTLMALTRIADLEVPNGEEVNVTYEMNQDIEFVSVPIVLKYYTGDRPLSFSARAGIVKHYRLSSESTINNFVSLHDAIKFRHANASTDVQFINKSNMSFLAGVGAYYRLDSGWQFFMEPSFTKAIIPMYEGTFDNLPFTYQLNIGLNYRLNR